MKCSKNIIREYIWYGIIFLIFCILVFSTVSCNSQTDLQNIKKTTTSRNIVCSSILGNQVEGKTPYFNYGTIRCYCGHGPAFILNTTLNTSINKLENCVLSESIHSIMQNIDDSCKEYYKAKNTGGTVNENHSGNKDDPDQEIEITENEQKTESTNETAEASKESSQVLNASDFIYNLLHLINTSRNQNGLPSLNLNASVCNVATIISQDMIDRNYFSHTTPEGKNIFNILQECGIAYGSAGENIQYSNPPSNASPGQYFNTWMASNVHRSNILEANYSQIGIGVSFDNSRVVAVLVFLG